MKRSVGIAVLLVALGGPGAAQEIKITHPSSGARWNIGDAQDIIWKSAGITEPNVKIMLWQGETSVMDIASSAPNTGRYRWTIPGSVAPGTYKVRVKAIGTNIVGIGAAFDITAAKITVTQPNANVTWKPGETPLIQWTHAGPMNDRVSIKLYPNQGGLANYSIVDSTENDGSYSWTVPGGVPSGEYQLAIRTSDSQVTGEGPNVTIESGLRRIAVPKERLSVLFGSPALSITDVTLKEDDDGPMIMFGYKNSGTGQLPKSSEMPVKPDFQVLIDGRVVARGSLIFPAFPAPPNWEVPTFFGHQIKYQYLFDYTWTIGNVVTVKINENKVNGMAADSRTYNLRPMALNLGYDVMITGATLDWNAGVLKAEVRIDGDFESYETIYAFDAHPDYSTGVPVWEIKADVVPGQRFYTLSKKRGGLKGQVEHKISIGVLLLKESDRDAFIKDIDHRNNLYERTFRR